jgi:transcriptional regulator with XRE-family HTH domain
MSTFGGRLRFARQYRGLSPIELASVSGVGEATIKDLEAGIVTTTPHWIALMADALEVNVVWLTAGKAAA